MDRADDNDETPMDHLDVPPPETPPYSLEAVEVDTLDRFIELETVNEIINANNEESRSITRDIQNMLSTVLSNPFRRIVQSFPHTTRNHIGEQTGDSEITERFDTSLPTEHSYLGNLDRVSGVDYLEAGKHYKLPIFIHHSLIFPGETVPMILSEYMFQTTEFIDENEDGFLFGLVFPNMYQTTTPDLYGVTCQIYEKGNDGRGNITLKSRAYQRFVVARHENSIIFPEVLGVSRRRMYANVKILPEIVLSDPLIGTNMTSLAKYRTNKSTIQKIRYYEAGSLAWPKFVYDQYDVRTTVKKVKQFLSTLEIETMPMDQVSLSFWCGKNVLLDTTDRMRVFLTDSVTDRMFIIGKSLDYMRYFICRRCKNKLANYNSLFAMSKQGVQSNYCNPSGFIHETNTIYSTIPDSVYCNGRLSTEFSWFPGYAWQMANCSCCDCHLGWKFIATKPNLLPKWFFGLSGTNVLVESANKTIQHNEGDHNRLDSNINFSLESTETDDSDHD